jgi:type IV secretory pathway protease TraF
MGLYISIQISPDKIIDSFYLSDGVVTIEVNEVDSRGRVVAGSFDRLSVLSDEEIFSLVNEMSQINFDSYYDLW